MAKTVKEQRVRDDGTTPYRLGQRNRVEWLTPLKADMRNRHRKLDGYADRWEVDITTPLSQVKESPDPTETEQRRLRAVGLAKDSVTTSPAVTIVEPKKVQEIPMAKAKSEKKASKKSDTSKHTTHGGDRQQWNEIGMCALIRYCGKKGFGKEKTTAIMEAMKLNPNAATVGIQLRKGRKDDAVPTLSKEVRAEFDAIAGDIPNDAKKSKASKAEKPAKKAKVAKPEKKAKSDKKRKKILKKADVEEVAEADAEDAAIEEGEEILVEV